MNPVNLFILSRVDEPSLFSAFENKLSARETSLKVKEHEISCMTALVNLLYENGALLEHFNHFYYSFMIPQIGKEFDLLRINANQIINIELKSQWVSEEKITAQLMKNKHYLSHLNRSILLYTFVESTQTLYRFDENQTILKDTIPRLCMALQKQTDCFHDNIYHLFRVSDFLVSPFHTPERFLKKQYFLTSQQENFKKEMMQQTKKATLFQFFAITGSPGTGKTLLLYDLAMQWAKQGRCCMIHCGTLTKGHQYLAQQLPFIDITDIKEKEADQDFSQYQFILVDESHRMTPQQFAYIVDTTQAYHLTTVFSYDTHPIFFQQEQSVQIVKSIQSLPNCHVYKLSNKVRTNEELASFIDRLMDMHAKEIRPCYPAVSIAFAHNQQEAAVILQEQYLKKQYSFLHYAASSEATTPYDNDSNCYDIQSTASQEFENVVMLLDQSFYYDDAGKLKNTKNPNSEDFYPHLLFQGLTRAREKLALIVIKNEALFKRILSIL